MNAVGASVEGKRRRNEGSSKRGGNAKCKGTIVSERGDELEIKVDRTNGGEELTQRFFF